MTGYPGPQYGPPPKSLPDPPEPEIPEHDRLYPKADLKVTARNGNYFIHIWDLVRTKLTLRPGSLFRDQSGQVWELLGRVQSTREYLVRPFSTTLSDEELRRLAGGD